MSASSQDEYDLRRRNPANPRSGIGMQQARICLAGASRRSGEKPQGRNVNLGRHAEVQTHGAHFGERVRGVDSQQTNGGGERANLTGERHALETAHARPVFGASKGSEVRIGLLFRSNVAIDAPSGSLKP